MTSRLSLLRPLALALGIAAACGEVAEHDLGSVADAGPASAEAGAAACTPRECQGQGIPDLACASGPTEVRCVPSGAQCRWQVSCAPTDGERADDDAGAPQDAPRPPDAEAAPLEPTRCGGIAGLACPQGEFCDVGGGAGGAGCGVADGFGVCEPQPRGCAALYEPVCGCDLHSYPSQCDAHAASASVLHDGLCTEDECRSIGGEVVYGSGATLPSCPGGKSSYAVPGFEPALCCY